MTTRLLVASLVLACAGVASAQKVTLRFNPPAGKSYSYAITQQNTNKAGTMDMSSTQTFTLTSKILSNKGGQVTVENKVSGVKVSMPSMKQQEASFAKTLEGMTTKMTVDSLGRPVGDAKASGNQGLGALAQGMSGMMSSYAYPKDPVGVGSKWTSPMDMGKMITGMMPTAKVTGGNMPVQLALVKFVNRGSQRLAQVDFTMKGKMTMSMPAAQGRQPMSFATTVDTKGTMLIDLATGLPVESSSSSTTVTDMGQQKITQTNKQTMKLK